MLTEIAMHVLIHVLYALEVVLIAPIVLIITS